MIAIGSKILHAISREADPEMMFPETVPETEQGIDEGTLLRVPVMVLPSWVRL